MPSIPSLRLAAVALLLATAPAAAGNGADFPFHGAYGVPGGKFPGCEDARLQREGEYVRFSKNEVFVHESTCRLLSWTRSGSDAFDVAQSCGSAKPYRERFRIDADSLTYRGRTYRRCRS